MKMNGGMLAGALLCGLCVATGSVKGKEVEQLRVTLSLRDGSTLVGTPIASEVELVTEFGGADVPLALLTSIQIEPQKKARLSFRNDDRLCGTWNAKLFKLDGLVGRLEIALTNIVKITVSRILPKSAGSTVSADGVWKLGQMEGGPRAWATATVLQDGTVLLAGGHGTSGDDHLSSCYIFDPATETFRQTGSLNTRRHQTSATLLNDGRVLVVGGYNRSAQWLVDAELYDPSTGRWTATQPGSSHGVAHSATMLADGRVFVFGGAIGSGQHSGAADIFDPRTDTWSPSRARFDTRGGHAPLLLADGGVLIAGGDGGPNSDAVLVYDPVSDAVRTVMRIPGIGNPSGVVALPDNRVLVVGGMENGATTGCSILNVSQGTWTKGPSLANAHIEGTCLQYVSGNAVLIGGSARGVTSQPLASVEYYDAHLNTWTSLPPMTQPRCFNTAAVQLRDGRIAVFGGSDGQSGRDTYELYTSSASGPLRGK